MSESNTLRKLNVGCGKTPLKGFINLDRVAREGVDVVFDLEQCAYATLGGTKECRLPFPDDHFDRMLCSHTIEHIHNFLPVMEELWRVARPGCSAIFVTPYGGCDIAFEDPTHVRQFFAKSWLYVSQTAYGAADYSYRADWDCKQLVFNVLRGRVPANVRDNETAMFEAMQSLRNVCEEMLAELIAVKPARLPGTGGLWDPDIKVKLV